MFVPYKPFQPSVMERSSLLGPFTSYKGNEVLRTRSQNWKFLAENKNVSAQPLLDISQKDHFWQTQRLMEPLTAPRHSAQLHFEERNSAEQ